MRSKLPAESGFSRCKDAIKSPCQPSTTLPPWCGVVHEGLCRRSPRSRVPGHGLGRGDPGHARGSAPRAAHARRGCLARALQPRRAPLEGPRPGGPPRAQDVRVELLAGGRGRGGGPPGQRIEGGEPPARLAARRAPVDGGGAAPPGPRARPGQPRACPLHLEPRGTAGPIAPDGRQSGDHHPPGLGRGRADPPGQPEVRQSADDRRRPSHRRRGGVDARSGQRPSCAGSTCTTCAETAGTTSATTSSSTASARCSRVGTGASNAM